jgi:flagellar basal-body rod protein FlgF
MFPVINRTGGTISREQRKLETTSNNLSNLQTPGFKRILNSIEKKNDSIGQNSYISLGQGAVVKDDDPMHVAIMGKGWFNVQTADGGVKLRRAGDFMLNTEGTLVTPSGQPVLSGGGPVTITGTLQILGDGTLIVDGQSVGKLDVTDVEDEKLLQPASDGNFSYSGNPKTATDFRLVQGALEQSNTNMVEEMSVLIELTRSADIAARIFKGDADMLRIASTEISRMEG